MTLALFVLFAFVMSLGIFFAIWVFTRILIGLSNIAIHAQKETRDQLDEIVLFLKSEKIKNKDVISPIESTFIQTDVKTHPIESGLVETDKRFKRYVGFWTDSEGIKHTVLRWSFYFKFYANGEKNFGICDEKCAFCSLTGNTGNTDFQKYYDDLTLDKKEDVHPCTECGAPCVGIERMMTL